MFTFEANYTVTSRGQSVTVNPAELSDSINANIYAYGLSQVIADAASGAVKDAAVGASVVKAEDYAAWSKTDSGRNWMASEAGVMAIRESTANLMAKKVAALVAGDWTTRGEAGVSRETAVGRRLMRAAMKGLADAAAWAKFTALSDDEQTAKIDANIAKNAEAWREKVATEIKRLDAEKAAKAKLADGLEIAI